MVQAAGIEDLDAVVSTIGGTVADPTADGEGNINLINAAIKKGVKKFVLVTSIGTGDSKDAPSEEVYNVLKPVLKEKEKAEEALKVRTAALTALMDLCLSLAVGMHRGEGQTAGLASDGYWQCAGSRQDGVDHRASWRSHK